MKVEMTEIMGDRQRASGILVGFFLIAMSSGLVGVAAGWLIWAR